MINERVQDVILSFRDAAEENEEKEEGKCI